MHTPKTAPLPRALAALLLAMLPWIAESAEVMVLGTPHLADLQPAALPAQEQRVVEALARFRPTQVCIEASNLFLDRHHRSSCRTGRSRSLQG